MDQGRTVKVLVAGAGPAGLSSAALMAATHPNWEIALCERHADVPEPGWGITLRDYALSFLGLDRRLTSVRLEGRTLRHAGAPRVDLPNPTSVHLVTCARASLTNALLECCRESGVRVRFGVDVAQLPDATLASYDLVIAADGAHSALRQRYASTLEPTVSYGRNRYAWLGVGRPFPKLTILISGPSPAMLAWAYRYSDEMSTLIVECTDKTWERWMQGSVNGGRDAVARTFALDIGGQQVVSRDPLHWQHFETVACRRLHHDNVVFVGDAAHTTHFSQGFGTMFAFDDAMALCSALMHSPDVPTALAAYEEGQQHKIAEFQATASSSMRWTEQLIEAAEHDDTSAMDALIAARWPNNSVAASPLDPRQVDAALAGRRQSQEDH